MSLGHSGRDLKDSLPLVWNFQIILKFICHLSRAVTHWFHFCVVLQSLWFECNLNVHILEMGQQCCVDRLFKVNREGSALMKDCRYYYRYALVVTGVWAHQPAFCWHDSHHPLSITNASRNVPQPWDSKHPNMTTAGYGSNPWFLRSVRMHFSTQRKLHMYLIQIPLSLWSC